MNSLAELRLRQLALVLLGLLVLQGLFAGAKLVFRGEPEPIAPAASTLELGASGYGWPEGDAQGSPLVARPLFWPGRQPYEVTEISEPVVAPPAQPAQLKDIKLLGVYSAGANSGIIVSLKGERRRLQIDDKVDGWTFTMMSNDGAIFQSGSSSTEVRLEHALPAVSDGKRRPQQQGRNGDSRSQTRTADRVRDNNVEEKGN
tara:strand:+ start:44678 stop:45283 length:606 start_codon:yes stop_codon:yes gene_type:complete